MSLGYDLSKCLKIDREAIDRGDKFGALLTDLSKAFDCINHSPLISKIDSYGVSPLSIKITSSYFQVSKRRKPGY